MIVIKAVLDEGSEAWEIDLVISDIRAILSTFQDVRINHVFREANAAADKVAKLGHELSDVEMYTHPDLRSIVRKDAFGCRLSCA